MSELRIVSFAAVLAAAGCRSGLPPEPPGRDAADASVRVPAWSPAVDVTRASAFAGETLDGGGHHHHHHHAAPASDAKTGDTPPAEPKAGDAHAGHAGHVGAR